jgi:tripartite-type tricarboxylate transporter receptor subunit TctC
LALGIATSSAIAQNWPDRPIHIFVAQGAGGGQDSITRYIADKLSTRLRQSIIIENRPGAGAIIGTQAAARATPDGYNFAVTSSASMASNPHLVKALPYDPLKDFIPVALLSKPGFLFSASSKLPATNLAELIALEKKEPGRISIAIDGLRNANGLAAAYLNKVAGVNMRLVPYTSPAQAMQDVINGNVDAFVAPPGVHMAQIEAGKLKPIAVTGSQREVALPNTAMIGETYTGFSMLGWLMISAPANTPQAALNGMNAALDDVLKDPAVIDWMLKFGSPSNKGAGTLAELQTFLRSEIELWGKITKSLGMEPQ